MIFCLKVVAPQCILHRKEKVSGTIIWYCSIVHRPVTAWQRNIGDKLPLCFVGGYDTCQYARISEALSTPLWPLRCIHSDHTAAQTSLPRMISNPPMRYTGGMLNRKAGSRETSFLYRILGGPHLIHLAEKAQKGRGVNEESIQLMQETKGRGWNIKRTVPSKETNNGGIGRWK